MTLTTANMNSFEFIANYILYYNEMGTSTTESHFTAWTNNENMVSNFQLDRCL